VLLDYLVKFEKPKMHANTTSAFNVDDNSRYVHQITLTVSLNVLINHINEHSDHSMRSKCPPPACTHDLRWSHQHSQVVDVMNLCFTHTLLYNTPNK